MLVVLTAYSLRGQACVCSCAQLARVVRVSHGRQPTLM